MDVSEIAPPPILVDATGYHLAVYYVECIAWPAESTEATLVGGLR
jgi:hypothetical protein